MFEKRKIQPNKVLRDWEHNQLQKVMQSKIRAARSVVAREVKKGGRGAGAVRGGE